MIIDESVLLFVEQNNNLKNICRAILRWGAIIKITHVVILIMIVEVWHRLWRGRIEEKDKQDIMIELKDEQFHTSNNWWRRWRR